MLLEVEKLAGDMTGADAAVAGMGSDGRLGYLENLAALDKGNLSSAYQKMEGSQ